MKVENLKKNSLAKYLDSLVYYTTPDVCRSSGQVERYMRTVINLIRVEMTVKSEWSSNLWKIQLVLNNTLPKAIGSNTGHSLNWY